MTIDELVEHIRSELMKKEGNAEREKTMVRLIHALYPIMSLIEPYCQSVLAKHWPGVPIYDDVSTLTADALDRDGIAVDVICRPHLSDCAVHNAPAEPPGLCDCGALIEASK